MYKASVYRDKGDKVAFIAIKIFVRVLIINTAVFVTVCLGSAGELNQAASSLKDSDRMLSAVNQIVRSQLSSGFFPYDFDFASGHKTGMEKIDGVNLVRQTGAAFVLGEYLDYLYHQPTRNALEIFLQKSTSRSLPISKGYTQKTLEWSGLYNRWQLWGILREPLYYMGLLFSPSGDAKLVSTSDDYELAWPSATALCLIAAINYYRVTGDSRFNDTIILWKNGLLALRVPGRGFREAPHYLSESPYVNGELWLALAEYSKAFPDDEVTKSIVRELDDYMLKEYGKGANRKFYQWGTMAAAVRAESTGDNRFTDFIYQLTQYFLEAEEGQDESENNNCAAVEGLATYVAFMNERGRGADPLVLRARDFIERAMKVNRTLQIDASSARLFSGSAQYLSELEEYNGAFVYSWQEPLMQIDLTQHCVNAMLRLNVAGLAR